MILRLTAVDQPIVVIRNAIPADFAAVGRALDSGLPPNITIELSVEWWDGMANTPRRRIRLTGVTE